MILETIIAKNLVKRETEKFQDADEQSALSWWAAVVYLICIIVYILAMLILWLRVIVKAFACSTQDGAMSVLTPSLYALKVFADSITLTCAK